MAMNERVLKKFKINDYLTVKLIEFGPTKRKSATVFVKDESFIQCAYILLYIHKVYILEHTYI